MIKHTEVITDSFVDYKGLTHHFVMAAISVELENSPLVLDKDEFGPIALGEVKKCVKIGLAICNPEDEFVEKIGALKAIGRAEKSEPVLYTSYTGMINTKLVKALLEQESNYLKNNPEKYIIGYSEAKDRFLKNKEMNELKENFSDLEKTVANKLEENPKFLDNVQTYLTWINNQKHGQCGK